MPTLLYQRRRGYREHAEAVEDEARKARAERRRARKIRALEDPQSREFVDDASLRAFAATLRARHPDIAVTIAPDRPRPSSATTRRLEASDELWPVMRTGSAAR